MTRLEVYRLKSMWGNYTFDYACSMSRGRSGGLIFMWDPNVFVKEEIWCDDAFIIVKGRWNNLVGTCFMINIYDPHDPVAKITLWNNIRDFMQSHRGKYVLSGDMNEVRDEHERYDSIFSRSEADIFNTFIKDTDVLEALPDIRVTALDKLWNWLPLCPIDGINVPFQEKLKRLKMKIRQWHIQIKSNEGLQKQELANNLKSVETKIEAGTASLEDREMRIKLLQDADKLDKYEAMDMVQKARIKMGYGG
ncbi:RNA-directed DNA polymerase, eukaryota, reverse transcriptase zinc-binding domain protein [Tanacetum coccineum]